MTSQDFLWRCEITEIENNTHLRQLCNVDRCIVYLRFIHNSRPQLIHLPRIDLNALVHLLIYVVHKTSLDNVFYLYCIAK